VATARRRGHRRAAPPARFAGRTLGRVSGGAPHRPPRRPGRLSPTATAAIRVVEAPRLAPQGRPGGSRHTFARRTSDSYSSRETGRDGGAKPGRASRGKALREEKRTSTSARREGEVPALAAAVTAHDVITRIELLSRLMVETCTKGHSTIDTYIHTDGTTAGLLAGENTQPLTHPTTRQKTTKHCVSTESTSRPDGTSVKKKSAPVNSSARSHTGGMAGPDRNDGVPSRLRGGVRAGPTAVGPALRRPLRPQPPRPPSCCATARPFLPSAAAAAPLRRRGWATAVVASAAVERHAAWRKRIAFQRGGAHC